MKPELVSKERLKALWHSFCEAQGWKPGSMTMGMRMAFESGVCAALEELGVVRVIELGKEEMYNLCDLDVRFGAVLVRAKEKP